MPAQEPVASIISRSNRVRCSSRCASSKPSCAVQLVEALLQLVLDAAYRLLQRRLRRHIVRVGVDLDDGEFVGLGAGQRVELDDGLDLVAEQRDAPGAVLQMGREDLDRVAAHAEGAAHEIRIVAPVLQRHEIGHQLPLFDAGRRASG